MSPHQLLLLSLGAQDQSGSPITCAAQVISRADAASALLALASVITETVHV